MMKAMARLPILLVILAVFISACGGGAVPTPGVVPNSPSLNGDGTIIFPRTIKDGQGNAVVIDHEPFRIVSATLGTDEILFDLVNSAHLVAITANAADPAQSNIANLASRVKTQLAKADPEAIIALQPDLVFVASYTDPAVIKQLKDAKLTVFVVNSFNNIKDVENNIRLVGQAVGQEVEAESTIRSMEAKLQTISQVLKDSKPVSVMYYAPGGYSDGPGTLVDDIITRAGGVNAVAAGGVKDAFPQVNDEAVVKFNPDYILLSGFNSYSPGFVDNFAKNPNFQTLGALQNRHTFVANDAHMASVSQYVVEGVSDVAALIHPDVYDAKKVRSMSATLISQMQPTLAP